MNRWIASLFLLVQVAEPARAEDDPLACATIADDTARLACYDRIYRSTVSGIASTGQWHVSKEVSKIDDSVNVFMHVSAKETVKDRFGAADYPTLWIVCRENSTDIYINFAGNFMADSGGYGRVISRVDKEKAVTKSWRESTDNSALGLWGGGSAIPFAKSLFGHDTLLIQATPFNDNALTIEFPITGLDEAIKPLREACHW